MADLPEMMQPGLTAQQGIRVTAEDLDTGESESRVIWDDYNLVCAGSCYLANVQAHANGTHVLTIKGRREQ